MRPELDPFLDEIRRLRPPGVSVLDIHAHLGRDEDGRSLEPAALLRRMDEAGIDTACVFALHDPDRRPAYRRPNDRVLAWAREADGRLIPFCRVDPADGARAEVERCLALGARGIKLHPRAQAFVFDEGVVDEVFAAAADARVPVLIHAGRGMPPIAEGLAEAALRHPALVLVLAHAAIADMALLSSLLADHPGVLYDTSVASPLDLLELLARVPAGRVAFASDPPYGRPLLALYMALRVCAAAGLDAEALRGVLGGTARRGLAGEGPGGGGTPPLPRSMVMTGALARLHAYASQAFTALVAGRLAAGREAVDLARSVCRDPQPGTVGPVLERLAAPLDAVALALDDPDGGRVPLELLHLSLVTAATASVEK